MGNVGLISKLENPYHAKLRELDTFIFFDTLVDVMVVQNTKHVKASLNRLDIFFKMLLPFYLCKHIVVLNIRGVEIENTNRSINMQSECIKSNFISMMSFLLMVVDVLALEQCNKILDYANQPISTTIFGIVLMSIDLLDLKHGNHITLPCSLEEVIRGIEFYINP